VQEWWAKNWGNVASAISLVVGAWTLYRTFRLARLIRDRLGEFESVTVLERLAEGRALIDGLVRAKSKRVSGDDARRLRHVLAEVLSADVLSYEVLTTEDREKLRIAIGELQCEPDNGEQAKQGLRGLHDRLVEVSIRLRRTIVLRRE
jgi:hypothetical protein